MSASEGTRGDGGDDRGERREERRGEERRDLAGPSIDGLQEGDGVIYGRTDIPTISDCRSYVAITAVM